MYFRLRIVYKYYYQWLGSLYIGSEVQVCRLSSAFAS